MAQSKRVVQYSSDSESDNDMELKFSNNKEKVKRKHNRGKWVPVCMYNNKDGAISKIKIDGIWGKTHTNITSEGTKVYYRCNQVKRHGQQCPASIHLLYHSENECVSMFESGDPHLNHEPKSTGIKQLG